MPRPLSLASVVRVFRPSIVGFFHGAFQPHLDQMQHTQSPRCVARASASVLRVECCRSSPRGRRLPLPDGRRTASPPHRSPPAGHCGPDDRRTARMEDRLRRSGRAPASLLSCTPDRAESRCPAASSLPLAFGIYTRLIGSGRYVSSLSASASSPSHRSHPVRLDVRKVLTVHTRCALVGAALGIGMRQDVLAVDLVVQGVEAIARLLPSLSRVTPSAASEHFSELIGCPISCPSLLVASVLN